MARQHTNSTNFLLRIGKLLLLLPVIILYIHYFFPQHWGFFILKPRSAGINIYPAQDGKIAGVPVIHNNMSYGIGISRKGRFLYKELSKIIDENKNLTWKTLPDSQITFIGINPDVYIPVKSYGFAPGKYLVTKTQTIPDSLLLNSSKIISDRQYSLVEIR